MPQGMVRLTVSLSAPARRTQGLLDALRYISSTIRVEEGCLGCAVWTGPDSTIQYVEEWATEQEMRRYLCSDLFTSLLAVIESAHAPPTVRFDFVTETRGLDYVAEVRLKRLN